jgi:hypothetical protein
MSRCRRVHCGERFAVAVYVYPEQFERCVALLTQRLQTMASRGGVADEDCACTAPGSLDNDLHYAASLRLAALQRSRAAAGLTRPFFSISHSVL